MKEQEPRADRNTLARSIGFAMACGLDIAILTLLGVLIGYAVDEHLHTTPWGLVVGLFIGLTVGIYSGYRIIAPLLR